MGAFKNLTGQRFGRLLVLDRVEGKYDRPHYHCKCDCGNIIIVESRRLTSCNTRSCGCLHKEQLQERNKIHGLRYTRLYSEWTNMKQRCYSTKDRYKQWQGRGIKVCSEWLSDFTNFYNWAKVNGYKDNLTLDRIDVNGNYEPTNCRWISKKEQSYNKTNTHYFEYKGQKKCLAEWAIEYNINKHTLYNRIYNLKWSMERALTEEVHK